MRHHFDMMRLREAVKSHYPLKPVSRADERLKVARKRGRVARNVGDCRNLRFDQARPSFGIETASRRIHQRESNFTHRFLLIAQKPMRFQSIDSQVRSISIAGVT